MNLMTSHSVDTPEILQKSLRDKGILQHGNGISPPLVLTYPIKDLDGDFVQPDGGTWDKSLSVNWDHYMPIGTNAAPVLMKSVRVDGEVYNLPIGQTKFFQKSADLKGFDLGKYTEREVLQASEQAQGLVECGAAPGVSMEFYAKQLKAIGPSLQRGRDGKAYQIDQWHGVGWAHTAKPVNQMAQVVAVDAIIKSLNKYGNVYHPLIKKSLLAGIPETQRKTFHMGTLFEKAVDTPDDGDGDRYALHDSDPSQGAEDNDHDADNQPEQAQGPQPGGVIAGLMNLNQLIEDGIAGFEMSMMTSDNPKAIKDCGKMLADIRAIAGKLTAYADNMQAQIQGAILSTTPSDLDQVQAKPAETDDEDGSIISKSFPMWKPRRIKISDIGPAVQKARTAPERNMVTMTRAEYEELLAAAIK
jgi:hypothetical protein